MDNNFVGAFPSNYLKIFINHASMVSEEKENTHLS